MRVSHHSNNRDTVPSMHLHRGRWIARCFTLLLILPFYFTMGAQTYCEPTVSNPLRYIDRVQIGDIDNTSSGTGFTTGGYADYTGLSTDVEIGQTAIPIVVDVFSNLTYGIQVWVDWDRDGEFTQVDDNIICDYGMDNNGANSEAYTFDISPTATVGATRMRVRLIYNISSCDDPCLDFTYGEVEDYTLNIKAPVVQLTVPIIGTITQPMCGTNTGSVVLSGLPAGVDWEITQYPEGIKHLGSGTSTTILGLSAGTHTFSVDEQTCPSAGDGLTGEYYNSIDLSGTAVLTRIDPMVDFSWGTGTPGSPVNADIFSVHWSGQVLPCYTETYTFRTRSDDGIRLWVDGVSIINNWTYHGPTYDTGTIALEAGKHYSIVLEFFENYGGAVAELEWSSASLPMEFIPESQLMSDMASTDYEPSSISADVSITLPLVTIFTLSGGGPYCFGSDVIQFSLDGSETDVTYQLYADGVALGSAVVGTGVSLVFPEVTSEGTYTVIANHNTNGCSASMDSSAIVYDITPSAPAVGTVTQPTCMVSTGSVVLSGLPSPWEIFQTPGDTSYYGEGNSTTISQLELGTYNFAVATSDNGTGLLGEYYNNLDLSGSPVLTRTDTTVDFDIGGSSPASPVVNVDAYSVRWSGQVRALYDEVYTFGTQSDDGIRLWVDGTQVINNWTDHSSTYNSGTITLEADMKYDIVLEFYESTGSSLAQLSWSSVSQAQEIIPKVQLFPGPTVGDGCFSPSSDDVVISAEHVTPVIPDSISVDRNIVWVADPDSITLTAYGGVGWTLRWYTDACGGTEIGTDTALTIASPATTTSYYALWETTCGQSACRSLDVTVLSNFTDSVTMIGETTATIYGSILSGIDIVEYGFYYSMDNATATLAQGGGALFETDYVGGAIDINDIVYSCDISGLINRLAYYCRAYMKDASDNYYYGDVVRFLSEKRDFSLALDGFGDALVVDEASTDLFINDWGAMGNTFSVEFWLKKGSPSVSKQVVISDTSATGGYLVGLNNGNVFIENHVGIAASSALEIDDQDWHHVACSYNNGAAYIYIDDSVSSELLINIVQPVVADANCFIGATYQGASLMNEFSGHVDAMRFWDVALTSDQVGELLYDIVEEGSVPNTVVGVGAGRDVPSLLWENLTVSLGFNVMSTVEGIKDFPSSFTFSSQNEMYDYPFMHNDARLGADSISVNLIVIGNAKPSPYLPRVYWRIDNTSSSWMTPENWSGYAYPGQGVVTAGYSDVTPVDISNDSSYCQYTVVDSSAHNAIISATPPEVQVLVDHSDSIGTYSVQGAAPVFTILRGVHRDIFNVAIDNEQGSIVLEEGSVEVFHD